MCDCNLLQIKSQANPLAWTTPTFRSEWWESRSEWLRANRTSAAVSAGIARPTGSRGINFQETATRWRLGSAEISSTQPLVRMIRHIVPNCRQFESFYRKTRDITATSYEHDGVSAHRQLDCFLNSLFRLTQKETSNLSITGLMCCLHCSKQKRL